MNCLRIELELSEYNNLNKIEVGNDSLTKLCSLKIANNQNLESIRINDGRIIRGNKRGAFFDVKEVIIMSIL